MRWMSSTPKHVGDTRIATEFLWFPKKLNHEWRWLETVKIRQVAYQSYTSSGYKLFWEDIKWIDDEKEKIK